MKDRIALLPEHFAWGGGLDFLRHIINGLSAAAEKYHFEIYIALKKGDIDTELHTNLLDFISQTLTQKISTIFYSSVKSDLAQVLESHMITTILPVNSDLGADFPIPWVAYIPDFQHKYLYENFTEHECFSRETAFAARLRDCKICLVNSESVRKDILTFYPWINPERIISLPYTPHPVPEWFSLKSNVVQEKYAIGKKYFMICNQFWIHKDHLTAFEAFSRIQDSDIQLICTGTMIDYRRPNYINEINTKLEELGITPRIKMLGHIPKSEQIALLKGASALIQPTLFEGGPGGGAVYDAVSLGIPVVISNIPVNREVEGKSILFFEAGDVKSLANCLMKKLQSLTEIPNEQLLAMGDKNRKHLGEKLQFIISKTKDIYHNKNSL